MGSISSVFLVSKIKKERIIQISLKFIIDHTDQCCHVKEIRQDFEVYPRFAFLVDKNRLLAGPKFFFEVELVIVIWVSDLDRVNRNAVALDAF